MLASRHTVFILLLTFIAISGEIFLAAVGSSTARPAIFGITTKHFVV
jgi:hypothetical protein